MVWPSSLLYRVRHTRYGAAGEKFSAKLTVVVWICFEVYHAENGFHVVRTTYVCLCITWSVREWNWCGIGCKGLGLIAYRLRSSSGGWSLCMETERLDDCLFLDNVCSFLVCFKCCYVGVWTAGTDELRRRVRHAQRFCFSSRGEYLGYRLV